MRRPRVVEVTFQPGDDRLAQLRAAGLRLGGACEGSAVCGTCAVTVDPCPPPTRADRRLLGRDRVERGVRLACTLPPGTYRVTGDEVCVTVRRDASDVLLQELWPGQIGRGVAVDIGTTTVMGIAFDDQGRPGDAYEVPNLQRRWGLDVMSRIAACASGDHRDLVHAVRTSVASVISHAFTEGASWVIAVGNTAMHHFAAGVDASPLGVRPYAPVSTGFAWRRIRLRGRGLSGRLWVDLVPPLGGLVGSDMIATILLLARRWPNERWVALDLGTNCEVALWWNGRVWFTSVPAGPAFEGGGLQWGRTAGEGAIARVDLVNGKLRLGEPVGVCGSAAVDLCAVCLEMGRLDESGRFAGPTPFFPLTADGIALTQRDVRELQEAKAAVELGVRSVLRAAGVTAGELDRLVLCGAFARDLSIPHAQAIGLLPGVPQEKVIQAGNTALFGAGLCLDRSLVEEVRRAARRVMLHGEPQTSTFIEALRLRPWS